MCAADETALQRKDYFSANQNMERNVVAEYLSAGMKIGLAVLRFLPNVVRKLWNYWKRPKLELSARYTDIEFTTNDGKRLLPHFPSIRIQNADSGDVTVDLGKFFINGESLAFIIQQNPYFSRTLDQNKPELKLDTSNAIINTFKDNWTKAKFLKIPAHEYMDIPLFPQRMGDSMYFKVLPGAKVFFPNRKIVIGLVANSRESHFGVNRMDFLKIIINCLANEGGG